MHGGGSGDLGEGRGGEGRGGEGRGGEGRGGEGRGGEEGTWENTLGIETWQTQTNYYSYIVVCKMIPSYHSEHQHLHGENNSQLPLGDGCSQSVEIHFHYIPQHLERSHHCLH